MHVNHCPNQWGGRKVNHDAPLEQFLVSTCANDIIVLHGFHSSRTSYYQAASSNAKIAPSDDMPLVHP
eukprot:12916518-Prorocentrum_lima.AAC.1